MKVVLRHPGDGGEDARGAKTHERRYVQVCRGRPDAVQRGDKTPEVERPFWLLTPQRRSEKGSNGKRGISPVTGLRPAKDASAEG